MVSAVLSDGKCAARNVLARQWRPVLSMAQFYVLHYIIDNSIEWGRREFNFTWDQIKNGIPEAPGSEYPWKLPPIGDMGKTSFYETVSELIELGALFRAVVHRTCTNLWLNLVWTPMDGIMSMKMAVSKRKKAELASAPRTQDDLFETALRSRGERKGPETPLNDEALRSPRERLAFAARSPIKQKDKQKDISLRPSGSTDGGLQISKRREAHQEVLTPEVVIRPRKPVPPKPVFDEHLGKTVATVATNIVAPVAPIAPSAGEIINPHISANTERRQAIAISSKEKDTSLAYDATWQNAWAEAHQGVPIQTWTKTQSFMIRAVLRSRFATNVPARHEFLDFCVRHWHAVIRKKFSWMKQSRPPSHPDISFIAQPKFTRHFLDAYAEKAAYEEIRLSESDQAELRQYMTAGLTREEALTKIGERRALSRHIAKENEVKEVNTEMLKRAEALNKATIEQRKQMLRDRAAFARGEVPLSRPMQHEDFPELGDLPQLDDLPPFDASSFN